MRHTFTQSNTIFPPSQNIYRYICLIAYTGQTTLESSDLLRTIRMTGLLHYIRTSRWLRGALVALLLGCVGIGVFGEWLVFKIIQTDIHQAIEIQIKSGAPSDGLVTIKISNTNPPSEFVWVEKHEFRYQGEMYDIVKQEVKNDTTYYTCIHDTRETALYANVEQQMQREFSTNPTHEKKQTELLKKIPKFYFVSTNSIFLGFTCYTQLPDAKQTAWANFLPAIPSPPPERVIFSLLAFF